MAKLDPRLLIVIIIVLVFIGGGWWIDHQREQQRATLTGYFEYRPTEISSRVTGRVTSLPDDEGDSVNAGDLLVQLNADPQTADLAVKQAQEQAAYAQYIEAKAGPRSYDIERQAGVTAQAQAELDKLEAGARPEDIEQAQDQVAAAKAQYTDAVVGPVPAQVTQAKADILKAYNVWRQAVTSQNNDQDVTIKAALGAATAREAVASATAQRYDGLASVDAVTKEQRDEADSDLAVAQANLAAAQDAWTKAQAGANQVAVDSKHQALVDLQTKLELLYADTRPGVISARKAQLDQARANLAEVVQGPRQEDIDAARAQLQAANASLDELQAGTRPEDIDAAKANWLAAKAAVDSESSTTAEEAVKAPFSGIIEHILVARGDLVQAGTPLIEMSNPKDIWLRIYVPEANLASVSVGTHASLAVDGIDSPVDAIVKSIATTGEFTPANLQSPEERGQQVFAVRLRLAQSDSRIKAGMAATVKSIGDWSP